jgi:hypothetical protein
MNGAHQCGVTGYRPREFEHPPAFLLELQLKNFEYWGSQIFKIPPMLG